MAEQEGESPSHICQISLLQIPWSPSLFVEEEEGEDVFDFCPSGTVLFPIFT